MEPSSTGLGGLAALKVAMAYGIPAAVAAMLGLLIMPPRTAREFTVRTICTVACSFMFGPAFAGAVIGWKPGLMEAMTWLAQHGAGSDDALLAKFYVLGPSMLLTGLPAWWVLGAYMRWMASMRKKGYWNGWLKFAPSCWVCGRAGGLTMNLQTINDTAITPALALLPVHMDTPVARVMLLAIGLQESRFVHRRQIGGPARGFWQFEKGTRASRGGVWGVFLHAASKDHLTALCKARSVACDPDAIYAALEYDDVLAAGVARLLLWTDPKALPPVGDADAGWALYLRIWRPGKPHPQTWPDLYRQALAAVGGSMRTWLERMQGWLGARPRPGWALSIATMRDRSISTRPHRLTRRPRRSGARCCKGTIFGERFATRVERWQRNATPLDSYGGAPCVA